MNSEISPRDMVAIERLVEGAAAETMTPQARAYEASLTVLSSVVLERNRFDAEASRERYRYKRAERDKVYAQGWCGILLGVIAALLLTLIVRG